MADFWNNTPDLGLPDPPVRRRRLPVEQDEKGTPVVYYVKVKCPNPDCGSDECPVYSSEPPIRYHKCKSCGLAFKSVEK